MEKSLFSEENIEFFFNLSEKIDVFIGKTKLPTDSDCSSRELIEIELEKLERIDNENIENSLEAIFSLCFGVFLPFSL